MRFRKLLLMLMLIAFGSHSFAGSFGGRELDPYEKTFIPNTKRLPEQSYQGQLRQSAAWQNFAKSHSNWSVIFNEENQLPHRAFGSPFAVTPGADAKSTTLNFIQNALSEFKIPVNELKFQTSNNSKYQNVFFKQEHNGLEVLFSRFTLKMTSDNKVISWGADVFDNIEVNTIPAIDAASAKNMAAQNIPAVTNVSDAVLKILPVPAYHKNDFHLVYEVTVGADIPGSPAAYYTLVDAHSGEILYRSNQVQFFTPLNTDANVASTLYKISLVYPATVEPLSNLKVVVGANTYHTDAIGSVPIPGSSSQSATFSLEGYWSKVTTGTGTVVPSFTKTLSVGSNTASFDTTTTIRHLSGYYHVNIVHDFMKQYFPAFTGLDFALPTKIDLTSGTCNAFYNGTSINFYQTGGGCNCMAQIGDVVYHEYGHGISDLFYKGMGATWSNGGMGEGYSDVWGMSITQLPVIGQGYQTSSTTTFVRKYNVNRKVYPADLTGEVHDNGEIIAGAWYDTGLNMGSWSGMTSLFASTYFDLLTGPNGTEGALYSDILLSALQHDDNDGDLSNGTPNFKAIIDAFALHGITLGNVVDLVHTPMLSATSLTPIHVTADLTNAFAFLGPNYVNLYYKTTAAASWTKLPMAVVTANTYAADIPAQVTGTLIRYYMELLDSSKVSIKTVPAEANATKPNIPYFILVDYNSVMLENFEGAATGWIKGIASDSASSGVWIIDKPMPSYNGATMCQPDIQHTPGGTKCAVTGNAPNDSATVGTNDVDAGKTTLQSPVYNLTTYNKPAIVFWRWYTNDQGSTPRTDLWRVYASSNGTTYVPIENIDVPDLSYRRFVFRIADVLPGATQITLRFVADDAGSGSIVEATVDDVEILELMNDVGLNEHTSITGLSAYPNPAKDQLSINIPSLKNKAELRIVNSMGAVAYSETIDASSVSSVKNISVKDFAAGIYVVSFQTSEGISRLNVVVQH